MKMTCSSTYLSSDDFHDTAKRMISEANREMKKLFRSSRKIQLSRRSGVILLVDDFPEQKTVLIDMLRHYDLKFDVHNVASVYVAKEFVSNNSENIMLVIVDIMLLGSPENGQMENGFKLVDWLREKHSNIPFVIATGDREKADEAEAMFPGVDVLRKGETNIDDYADAIGLTVFSEKRQRDFPSEKMPKDLKFS